MRKHIVTLLTVGALNWAMPAFSGEIHEASASGDLERVQALLKASPTLVSSRDTNGMTALHCAVSRGHSDMTKLLLANKADVNAKANGDGGGTALHMAVGGGRKDIAALLLADKADVNAGDKRGHTPLGIAAVTGKKDIAQLLLAFDADINAKDGSGWTALHTAVSFKRDSVAELLRQQGGHD